MMELLAPAGDRSALEAALYAGADAVYLGLTVLNARKNAGNFDEDALLEAARYCHTRNRRLYVTVNTMVTQEEIPLVEGVARALARAGVDGAIVQDLGVARALRAMLPSLALHASTQLAVHNWQGIDAVREMGFTRAVLAREMTLPEIEQCARRGVELEVFGHGALCTACSGQCLFSSMIGGRSGNRGLCAQPCRLPFRIEGPMGAGAGDLLSPKDLMTLTLLEEIERAGAHSIKLEGRLKGPEYVYAVTCAYRRALDGEAVEPGALSHVFNRGYTTGYLSGVDDRLLMSDPDERHVLSGPADVGAPQERAVRVEGTLVLHTGQNARLSLSDGAARVEVEGEAVQVARSAQANPARLRAQIEKMGGTPYALDTLRLQVDANAFAPASVLNALRRSALDALDDMRADVRRGCADAVLPLPAPPPVPASGAATRLCVQSHSADLLRQCLAWGADEVVWTPDDVTARGLSRAPEFPFTLALPPVLPGDDLDDLAKWAALNPFIAATLVANVGQTAVALPGAVRADALMNVANRMTVRQLGMPFVPSVELTAGQIRALDGDGELIVYGRAALMQMRHCPLNAVLGGGRHDRCDRCGREGREGRKGLSAHALIDRMGARFPLSRQRTSAGCVVSILNSVPLMLLRRLDRLPPAAAWRVVLTDEDARLCEAVVRCHRMALDGADFTTSPYWDLINALPTTTGHYFRGVE